MLFGNYGRKFTTNISPISYELDLCITLLLAFAGLALLLWAVRQLFTHEFKKDIKSVLKGIFVALSFIPLTLSFILAIYLNDRKDVVINTKDVYIKDFVMQRQTKDARGATNLVSNNYILQFTYEGEEYFVCIDAEKDIARMGENKIVLKEETTTFTKTLSFEQLFLTEDMVKETYADLTRPVYFMAEEPKTN